METCAFGSVLRANHGGDDLDDDRDHENNQGGPVPSLVDSGCGFAPLIQGCAKVLGLVSHGGTPGE